MKKEITNKVGKNIGNGLEGILKNSGKILGKLTKSTIKGLIGAGKNFYKEVRYSPKAENNINTEKKYNIVDSMYLDNQIPDKEYIKLKKTEFYKNLEYYTIRLAASIIGFFGFFILIFQFKFTGAVIGTDLNFSGKSLYGLVLVANSFILLKLGNNKVQLKK